MKINIKKGIMQISMLKIIQTLVLLLWFCFIVYTWLLNKQVNAILSHLA